jgi:multidrug resistance efflux pump
MTMPIDSAAGPSAEQAAAALDRALGELELRVDLFLERRRAERIQARANAMMQSDRGRLAQDLDQAKAREEELQAAADAASHALEHAIAEVRLVLGAP